MQLQVGIKAFLLNEKGQFLILEKNTVDRPHHRGKWDIPGGRIEIGIPLLDNLVREIKEETGLDVDISFMPELIAAQDIFNKGSHVVRLSYIAKAKGDVVLSSEHLSFQWLTVDEFSKLVNEDEYLLKEVLDKGLLNSYR